MSMILSRELLVRIGATMVLVAGLSPAHTSAQPVQTETIFVLPQNDQFTFEIGRVVHAKLSEKLGRGLNMVSLQRGEMMVSNPGMESRAHDGPDLLHGTAWPIADRTQMSVMLRATMYVALLADSIDNHWQIEVRARDVRIRHSDEERAGEFLMGKVRYDGAANTGEQIARMIVADTMFKRMQNEAGKKR